MDIQKVGIGRIIAVIVLILVIVLALLGRLDNITAGLIGALAVADIVG